MGGARPLACKGFVESRSFEKSKHDLMIETGMTARQVDNRLEALVWALSHTDGEDDSDAVVTQVAGRNLWVAVIPRGIPPLHVYLRRRAEGDEECEWLWIERRDWSTQ